MERKKRKCLKCGKYFNSEHKGNRICKRCKGLEVFEKLNYAQSILTKESFK